MTTFANLETPPRGQSPFLYGTIVCGADTWKTALGKGEQVFSFDSRLRSQDPTHRINYSRTDWTKYPALDLLIVMDDKMNTFHDKWMEDWVTLTRAKHLLIFHGVQALTAYSGKGF